ncbi:hypothetical protein [Mesonia maritima]|uniref:Vacuolar-type H+-ATPase subunit I/STV1 n=1 Tax=Mesonia maritima TaxID=1793873 RepID=A0ABU1K914_9FLAO|nr:hypothetical protein [Mesonia maritima]MDR6302090.1 vacuolar-type H+-ATPase subunit I/STV1 [Mesonia maritima]
MNNFDKNIKNKLEERRLTPSDKSWEKLSDKLAEKEQKSTKKIWWLGLAASFIAGILISTLLFKTNQPEIQSTEIIVEEKSVQKIDAEENFSEEIIPEKDHDIVNVIDSPEELKSTKTSEKLKKEVQEIATPKKSTPVEVVITEQETTPEEAHELFLVQQIDKKAQEVVDHVKELSKNREVTDAEIDALIKEAQLEIRTRDIFKENRNKVNAQALLQNVEAELDQSFRERIFVAIENGFTQVKSAVTFLNR